MTTTRWTPWKPGDFLTDDSLQGISSSSAPMLVSLAFVERQEFGFSQYARRAVSPPSICIMVELWRGSRHFRLTSVNSNGLMQVLLLEPLRKPRYGWDMSMAGRGGK